MKIAIKDTSVFMDLEYMGVLDNWFSLGYETYTSSFVVLELETHGLEKSLKYVRSDRIRSLDSKLEDFIELYEECTPFGLSPQDVSILHFAQEKNAILLTCDQDLKETAEKRSVECRGSIWVLDQLVECKEIRGPVAAAKLEFLLGLVGKKRRHLPRLICETYIKKWRAL